MAGWAMRNEWAAQARVAKMSPEKRMEETVKAKIATLEVNLQTLKDNREAVLAAGLTEDQYRATFDHITSELTKAYESLNNLAQ